MHWGLWRDVSESQGLFVLIDYVGRDLLADNLIKDGWLIRVCLSEGSFLCG
jgi:hypothetical protein